MEKVKVRESGGKSGDGKKENVSERGRWKRGNRRKERATARGRGR